MNSPRSGQFAMVTLIVAFSWVQAAVSVVPVCVASPDVTPTADDEVGRLLNEWRIAHSSSQSNTAETTSMVLISRSMDDRNVRRIQILRRDVEVKVRIDPEYTKEAQEKGIAGIVRLVVRVAQDGTVQSATPICGDPLLVPPTTTAALKWVFEPLLLDGRPVDFITEIAFELPLKPARKR